MASTTKTYKTLALRSGDGTIDWDDCGCNGTANSSGSSTTVIGAVCLKSYKGSFTVGTGALMEPGDTSLIITLPDIQLETLKVYRDGGFIEDGENEQFSYTVDYTSSSIRIDFNDPVIEGMKFRIFLNYLADCNVSYQKVIQIHQFGATVTVGNTTDILIIDPEVTLNNLEITLAAEPRSVEQKLLVFAGGLLGQGNIVVSNLSLVPNTGYTLLASILPTQIFSGDNFGIQILESKKWRRL